MTFKVISFKPMKMSWEFNNVFFFFFFFLFVCLFVCFLFALFLHQELQFMFSEMDNEITSEEVLKAIKQLKTGKSKGLD